MLGRLGVGEVPISISGDPTAPPLRHTIRDVGGVTHAARAGPGRATSSRCADRTAPAGTSPTARAVTCWWSPAASVSRPLRPALLQLVADRDRYRNVALLYGARSPADQLYPDELEQWGAQGIEVHTIVDHGTADWRRPRRPGDLTDPAGRRRPDADPRPAVRTRGDDAHGHPGAARPRRHARVASAGRWSAT